MQRPQRGRKSLAIAIGAGLLLAAAAAGAATWRVPLDAADIQAGIDLSAAGDTLLVAPDTYLAHGLRMKSGLVLLGNGAPGSVVIDAQQQGMILDLTGTGSDTRIANITFRGGLGSGDDPGPDKYPIACIGSSANFENCIFRDNRSENDGAGFYCLDAAPILVDCAFIDNQSISGSGGGFCSRRSNPVLVNCVFSGNTAAGYGGGVFLTGTSSTPRLQKCVIEGNSAYFGGGLAGAVAPILMAGCEVRGNSAIDAGGGLHLQAGSSLEAHTSIFFANTAVTGKTLYAQTDIAVVFHCSEVDYLGIEGGCIPGYDDSGCLQTPSATLGWGEIKAIYR